MKSRFALVLALLILPLPSYAQARILIESRFQTGGEDLSGIVERCAALAAGREGFEAIYSGENPDGAASAAVLRCDSSLDQGDYSLSLALFAPGEDQTALAEAGLSFANVVKATVLLSSMDDFAKVNAIYAKRFPSSPPARAAFAVAKLPLGGLVEIEAIAAE